MYVTDAGAYTSKFQLATSMSKNSHLKSELSE